MKSKIEKQIVTILILPNISRSNGNQTMKYEQLAEYNTHNKYFS